jgi:hypothetical protein
MSRKLFSSLSVSADHSISRGLLIFGEETIKGLVVEPSLLQEENAANIVINKNSAVSFTDFGFPDILLNPNGKI